MELGKTLSLFGPNSSWADAMDQLMPEWMNIGPTTPTKGKIVTVHFTDEQKERFNNIFLEAWGEFAISHKADGVDLIISYINKGTWKKMVNAAAIIQKDIGETDIFSLSDDEIRGHFMRLFEQKYEGFKTKVYKGARGVGAELSEDDFIAALVEKVKPQKSSGAAAKGGAHKRRITRRKRIVKRKTGRKTKKARKASRKIRKTKKSRKSKNVRKVGRKTRKTTRKSGRKH
jgi:hypothetical protein